MSASSAEQAVVSETSALPLSVTGNVKLLKCPVLRDDGSLTLHVETSPGLYQMSVLLDGQNFNWDDLYEDLHKFGNTGQRTGPWDFSINHSSKPLVPTYWVSVNGKELGPWYFQRISLEDLAGKRFRGRAAFYLDGKSTIDFKPFRDFTVDWLSAVFENDPEDYIMQELPSQKSTETAFLFPKSSDTRWQELAGQLEDKDSVFNESLNLTIEWVSKKEKDISENFLQAMQSQIAQDVPVLLTSYKLTDNKDCLERALDIIDTIIEQPAWGNQEVGAYGHNGDMGAMSNILWMAVVCDSFAEELGEDRYKRLLNKIAYQADIFFNLILLSRDYWGGSVAQDHGWRSLWGFGAASIYLLDLLPGAEKWLRYCMPRLQRCIKAMPSDGVIPKSSYNSTWLYLNELTLYRDALLTRFQIDIYDQIPCEKIIDCLFLNPSTRLIGGGYAMNRMAEKFANESALALSRRSLVPPPGIDSWHPASVYGYYLGVIENFLSAGPAMEKDLELSLPAPPAFTYYEDSCLINYTSPESSLALALECGPNGGYTQYRNATGPCDRMGWIPDAGHFTLKLDGKDLLCSPPGGYSLQTSLSSVLLIDGQGQIGDIGYPMSIPGKPYAGEEIESAVWHEDSHEGFVRLNLTPVYPEVAGLVRYTRDFLLNPDGSICCRDTVVCHSERTFTWLFQANESLPLEGNGDNAFLLDNTLSIKAGSEIGSLKSSIGKTQPIWSYSSDSSQKYRHMRFETTQPTRMAVAEFQFSLKD
ncbi:MAG: hypothetical protein ACYTFY_10220 [Planctomycetota bacterium]|jgi:hypothetical protein